MGFLGSLCVVFVIQVVEILIVKQRKYTCYMQQICSTIVSYNLVTSEGNYANKLQSIELLPFSSFISS